VSGALEIITVVLSGLVAGGLLVVQLGLVPTVAALPAAASIRLHVAFDHYVERSMPALTIATLIVGIVDAAVHSMTAAATALSIAALLATAIVAAISQLVNVPMNATMRNWEPGTAPPEYASLRVRWDRAHLARTLAGEVAFVCFAVALVLR
jgi:hypothetical protein